jgi:hypothetical protein
MAYSRGEEKGWHGIPIVRKRQGDIIISNIHGINISWVSVEGEISNKGDCTSMVSSISEDE